jgi:hypothetical protein
MRKKFAFALNEKECEIFIIDFYTPSNNEIEEFTEVCIDYSKDLSDSPCDENCSSGIEDILDIDEAIEEFPYIQGLNFYPFDYEENGYGFMNYYGAKEVLLKHVND